MIYNSPHTAMLLAAASQTTTGDLIGTIFQYGLLGAAFLDVSLFHKVLVPRWVLDDKQRRIDQLEAALDTMTGNFMTEVMPALTNATSISREYVEVLQERNRGL